MATSFLAAMHGGKGNLRLVVALIISLGIAVPLLWLNGAIVILAAVVAALAIVGIAHRHFHGVTGDVLGATNELARMVSIVVLVALI
jgi:adenosylcobinamide-GDP ribazoletransferase